MAKINECSFFKGSQKHNFVDKFMDNKIPVIKDKFHNSLRIEIHGQGGTHKNQ